MSFQRSAKTYSAAASDSGMGLLMFFKRAQEALESAGYEDSAFYFEQVVDHLRDGGSLPEDIRNVEKVLGL